MPGVRLEDLLKAIEVDDSPETRELARQIAQEEGVDLAPEFETRSAKIQEGLPTPKRTVLDFNDSSAGTLFRQHALPNREPIAKPRVLQEGVFPAKSTDLRRALGDESYGVTGEFEAPRAKIPALSPDEAMRRAATRFTIGAAEAIMKPIVQVVSEFDKKTREAFPHGDIGLDEMMQRHNLLMEATHADRFAQKLGGYTGFFLPINAGGQALRASMVGSKLARMAWLAEPTLFSVASVLDARSQEDRAGELGIKHTLLNAEDWKTFGVSMALIPAGLVGAKAIPFGVEKLLRRPVAKGIKDIVGNAAVGGLFGAYTGHKGHLAREEFAEEVLAGALSNVIAGPLGHLFSGDGRPYTKDRAKAVVGSIADAVSDYSGDKPDGGGGGFGALAEGAVSGTPAYEVKRQLAETVWRNRQAAGEELPTYEQMLRAFKLSPEDTRKIMAIKVGAEEASTITKNRSAQEELDAVAEQGPEALQEHLEKTGEMPEAERKLYETRKSFTPEDVLPGAYRESLQRPEGGAGLVGPTGEPIAPPKPATEFRQGPGVEVPSQEATARLEQVAKNRPPEAPFGAPAETPQPPKPAKVRVRVTKKAKKQAAPVVPLPVRSEGLGEPGVLASAPVGPKAISAPPPPDVTQVSPSVGRQVVAPGEIPPPERAPAAPEELSGMEAAQRLRTIRSRLQEKGLPPAERASLQQERTKIIGSDLPFDPDFARQRTVRQALATRPPQAPSQTEAEAVRRARNPKTPPKERAAAQAVLRGGSKAKKTEATIEKAKPKNLGRNGDQKLNMGVDPQIMWDWFKEVKRTIEKKNPADYEALNSKSPGPREIERMVGELEDLIHMRPTQKEIKLYLEAQAAQYGIDLKTLVGTMTPYGKFDGRHIPSAMRYQEEFGPAGKTLAQGEARVWRRVLALEQKITLSLKGKELEWGAYRRGGRVKDWTDPLSAAEEASVHDYTDEYAFGSRGKDLPALKNDNERMMAAAFIKAEWGVLPEEIPLNDQQRKIVEGFAKWNQDTYGTFIGNAIEQGAATKAHQATNPGGGYLPKWLTARAFAPVKHIDFIEKHTPMVRTDQGVMTKAEWVKRSAKAKKIQDAIVRQLLEKAKTMTPDDAKLYTEQEIRKRLAEYQEKYLDPYAQPMQEKFSQGLEDPETNLTLHRYFDVSMGVESNLMRLMGRYMRSNLLAIESAREWGPQRERAEALVTLAGLQGFQRKALAEAFNISMMQDPKKNLQSGRLMSEARGWAIFAKLGKTVFFQFPQNIMIKSYTDWESYLKALPGAIQAQIYEDAGLPIAIRKKLGSRLQSEYVQQAAVLVGNELETAIQQLHGWGPKMASAMLKRTGMSAMDSFNRRHAALAGRLYAEKLLFRHRYGTSERVKRDAEFALKEGLADPKDVASALSGAWVRNPAEKQRLLAMFGETVSYRSQFRTLPIDMPMAAADGTFRGVYDLKRFAYRATAEALRVFDMRNPTSPLRNRATAARWLSGVAATGVSGWLVNRMRDAIMGRDPEDDPWWVSVRDTLVSMIIFPIFKDLYDDATGKHGNPATALVGPYVEHAGENVEAVGQSVAKRSLAPASKQLARNIPETPFERLGPGFVREKLKAAGAQPTTRKRRVRVRVRRRVHTSQ